MAKEKEEKKANAGTQTPPTQATEERPNRDAYARMFAEDNPDIDFEDKEARYGRMAEERQSYRDLAKAGRGLSEKLDRHRWLGAMFQDLANDETGTLDPVTWMANNGIDVQKAMEDEDYRKQAAEGLMAWQKKQAEGEANSKAIDDNLQVSANTLDELSKEMNISDEDCDKMWNHLFETVIVPGMKGEVTRDTWILVRNALNYDNDISSAKEQAAMQARNEKIQNRVKTYDEQQVPPSFGQGQGRVAATKPQKKESLMDFVRRNS